jgi:anthranilate phosphoribosyltransferase
VSEPLEQLTRQLNAAQTLAEMQVWQAVEWLASEKIPAERKADFLAALSNKGETPEEIAAFARALRDKSILPPIEKAWRECREILDVVGTGGDRLSTFNISTTAAILCAAAGVAVAKHGNRAVSSSAGSADVLEALGVDISLDPAAMARCVDECGVGFLFAQSLHASMRHAGPTRREIGIRTVFNILGPLTNPAGAKRQLLGVYDARLAPLMAEVAGRLGTERTLVVTGHPGMDEVSASGPTTIAEYDAVAGGVRTYTITPEELGIARTSLADISGGDAPANAALVRAVLAGEHGARRDVVLMNAAAAIRAAGEVDDLVEGIVRAREAIDSGRALEALDRLVVTSKRLAAAAS